MAITAYMTTHDGIALTDAYCYIPTAYVKKFNGEWSGNDDDGWTQGSATWKLIYDVLIYKDKDTRDDEAKEKTMRIKNNHVDHFKIDYSLDATDNPIKLAYADLKANDQLSNVQDV